MLDIKFIRENAELVKDAIRKKHLTLDLEELLKVDAERLVTLGKVETARARQNVVSQDIVKASPADRAKLITEMTALKAGFKREEDNLALVMKRWQTLMLQVPNLPDVSVPEGEDDKNNLEIRIWGEKPSFSFTAKSYLELMPTLGLMDLERGAKVAGFRGYFLQGDCVKLSFALWQYALNNFAAKGFTPFIAPSLLQKEPFIGTGYLPQGEEDLYKTQDGTYLAGTAEVAMMSYFADEVVPVEKLPLQWVAFSPCFRREAGSHGKDTKGLMRVHEFFKLEQIILCEASHEMSVKQHEVLTQNAEDLLQALGLPYRVVINCGGDLGLGQVKKYDIETWVASEGRYRETHSASYFHDFQTRRLNIRYRDKDGKLRFLHSLNNTVLATPRLLIPFVEHYQQADGSITIPEVLRPYLGGLASIRSSRSGQVVIGHGSSA